MKVILLETVEGIGTVGQEIKVKDGYGRNFLIPRGKAIPATGNVTKVFKDRIAAGVKAEAKSKEHARKTAEEISSLVLGFKVKAGEDGKLFGSVTTSQIADALKEKGFDIDRKKIHQVEPIKHTGTHDITIKLYQEVNATIKV